MKTNLNWKKKWCDDKSAHWYSAKVPIIGWEYITDKHYKTGTDQGFIAGLYFGKYDDDITRFSNKFYKTEEAAMLACEKHLQDTAEKFINWIEKNTHKAKLPNIVTEKIKPTPTKESVQKIELISYEKMLDLVNIKKYAVYHKPTKTWVYFKKHGKKDLICLCSKQDASTNTSKEKLKNLLLKCEFNSHADYGLENFLEFQIKSI